jgi:hypothetical protein
MKNYWNLKLSKYATLVVLVFISYYFVSAQGNDKGGHTLADESYIFPIRPGSPASLSGTMGELRSTHFHSGIDIRTNNEIGWPVLAAKSGYISRAGVSGTGFGNVLYINHPDGNTTVYGHLHKFNGKVADHILKERYRKKRSSIDLLFEEGQFQVKQGDTIGFAGNTGSSGGPHLHFDIRKENSALDPLSFGFTEVRDKAYPLAQKVALKTLNINSRINDQFGRFEFYLVRNGNTFSLPHPILATGTIGIELMGYDQVDNPRFKCGINFIEVAVDGTKIFEQQIEEVNLAESRSIYSLMDFKALRENGNSFYKLYIDDANNKLSFYGNFPGNGQIKLSPGTNVVVTLTLRDLFGNTSTVNFKLKSTEPEQLVPFLDAAKKPFALDVQENTLKIETKPCGDSLRQALVYSKNEAITMVPTYYSSVKSVYLIDLRKLIPDSIVICSEIIKPALKQPVPPGVDYKYYSNLADIQFPKGALFDTLYFGTTYQTATDSSELFIIGNPLNPLGKPISVSLKPKKKYAQDKTIGVYRQVGKGYSYEGGVWELDQIRISPREFGTFTILKDTTPPTVTVLTANNQSVRFRIRDNLSGINSFEATINGKWLLMNHDAKTSTISSERFNDKEPIRGLLELTVTDNAGNKKIIQQRIP